MEPALGVLPVTFGRELDAVRFVETLNYQQVLRNNVAKVSLLRLASIAAAGSLFARVLV